MTADRSTGRDCLLIDLDGTLVDSAPDIAAAANRQLISIGREPLSTEKIKGMVGDGFAPLMERALAASGGPLAEAEQARLVQSGLAYYFDHVTDETRPYPGAAEALAGLKAAGWRLALCTNKPLAPSVRILEDLGLAALFEAVAGGDSYPHKKPHPGHLLDLLAEMGAEPGRAVMLGDHRNDARAAQAAGLPVVLCRFGYSAEPLENLDPDAVIERFEELPGVLSALG